MLSRHPGQTPSLVYANSRGEILDHPGIEMAGSSCGQFSPVHLDDLIELPEGSELFVLPGRVPVGIDPVNGSQVSLDRDPFSTDLP